MVLLGYALSSEEHGPQQLVRQAQVAEEAGFEFLMISDHFHPWTTHQGHSPFVWAVLGGIAATTNTIRASTSVTCPTTRMHPAVVAQAAATTGAMFGGRFSLAVGSGEALNEHIIGQHWPTAGVRLEMLEEAIDVIRKLWSGDVVTQHGKYFAVERARLFDVPEEPIELLVAAAAPASARLAGANGGIVATGPDPDLFREFEMAGGKGKPRYGQVTVSWDSDERAAREQAMEWWPTTALPWEVRSEVPTPELFDAITEHVPEEAVTSKIICTSGPEPIIEAIDKYAQSGFDHVYLHQVGPRQEEFLRFASQEIAPALSRAEPAAAG